MVRRWVYDTRTHVGIPPLFGLFAVKMCHTRCHTVPPKREQGTFFFYCCVIGYFGPETEMDEHLTHRRPVVVAIGGFLCGGGDAKQRMYSFWG